VWGLVLDIQRRRVHADEARSCGYYSGQDYSDQPAEGIMVTAKRRGLAKSARKQRPKPPAPAAHTTESVFNPFDSWDARVHLRELFGHRPFARS
jgi:hypothetical protein